jgi:hypothetical protein
MTDSGETKIFHGYMAVMEDSGTQPLVLSFNAYAPGNLEIFRCASWSG